MNPARQDQENKMLSVYPTITTFSVLGDFTDAYRIETAYSNKTLVQI